MNSTHPHCNPSIPRVGSFPTSIAGRMESSSCSGRRASVAFGGGGARGIAHLGVMQAIAESGVTIDHLSGISIGAIAAALCALEPDTRRVQSKAVEYLRSPQFQRCERQMFGSTPTVGQTTTALGWLQRFQRIVSAHRRATRAMRSLAILPPSALCGVVEALYPDIGIEDLPIPLTIVALDILSGQRVELSSGSLRDAVRASASIPGVFEPVAWGELLLCDIGMVEVVPTVTAKRHATDLTIAVDVADPIADISKCNNVLELLRRVQHVSEYELRHHSLAHADQVIRPAIGTRPWFDYSNPEDLIEAGYLAGLQAVATI